MIEAKEIKITKEQFEVLKKNQLRDLDELELEATALLNWVAEFKQVLQNAEEPAEVILWGMENDIEKEFKHIELK